MGDAFAHKDIGQAVAPGERLRPDAPDAVGDPEVTQMHTVMERTVPDALYAVGDGNGGQSFADMEAQQRRNKMLIIAVVLVVTCPLWIGLLAGGFGLFIGLFFALLALICVPVVVGIALLVSGVPVLLSAPPLGITMIGAALVLFGLDGILFIPLLRFMFKGIGKLAELGVNFFKGLFNNRAGVTTV